MTQPTLRQYNDLSRADFQAYPVWMRVYGRDEQEPWYNLVDEITYRPWNGHLPYQCSDTSERSVVVYAAFQLADGTLLDGFMTPPSPADGPRGYELSYLQPELFLPDGSSIGFWWGTGKIPAARKDEFYAALTKSAAEVFPITFGAAEGLVDLDYRGSISGFLSMTRTGELLVEI